MDKLRNLKMSNSLRDKIKENYNKEKNKPIYKIRKAMNYEVEIDTSIIAALIIISVAIPVANTITKFNTFADDRYVLVNNSSGGNLKDAEGEKGKD